MNKGADRKFKKIVESIKSIKIQGARNVAKAAVKAYFLFPSERSKKILLSSRPTEPMMAMVLKLIPKHSEKEILNHFESAQDMINKTVLKIIKNRDIILTHCHSTNVTAALIQSHKKKKKFEVYATESRPLFQGRKTANELRRIGIKVTMFVDSAMDIALKEKKQQKKVFIGADALLPAGIINKVGSGLLAQIARDEKVPLYIIADSWKFTKANVPIEQRPLNEIWDRAPKNIKIKNPAFEFVPKKFITGIVSEFGLMKYDEFVSLMKKKSTSQP